jgi:hypothetical protein
MRLRRDKSSDTVYIFRSKYLSSCTDTGASVYNMCFSSVSDIFIQALFHAYVTYFVAEKVIQRADWSSAVPDVHGRV